MCLGGGRREKVRDERERDGVEALTCLGVVIVLWLF